MRPLSQLLPIARARLISNEHPNGLYQEYDEFTCFAASFAADHDEMTRSECWAIRAAIMQELQEQQPPAQTIYDLLIDKFPRTVGGESDPAFFPYRDAWLDAFQAKLEAQERSTT